MQDRLPEQQRGIEGSGGNLLSPTERGGQRWKNIEEWLGVGATLLLGATTVGATVILTGAILIPEVGHLAGKLVEKVVTHSAIQVAVGLAMVAVVGLGTFFAIRYQDSSFRS